MTNPNPIPHPFLLNPGTRQEERHLSSLDPQNINIDDRKLGDLLVYLYEFAGQINFYDLQLGLHDWQQFFVDSLPFQLARLQHLDLNKLSLSFNEAISLVRAEPRKDLLIAVFLELYEDHFALLHQLSLRLNASNHSFAPQLDRLIASNLQKLLKQYIGHCNCLEQQGLSVGLDLNPLLEAEVWGLEMMDMFSVAGNCFTDPKHEVGDVLLMAAALSDIQGTSISVLAQAQKQLLSQKSYLQ
ncbi:MAG: hypothetical protein AAFN10_09275, partial [Bacteroidota bacterium]